jgi:hypothetical protein
MRHILLLLAVAAMMLTLMSVPALAQAPQNENNCYGANQSGRVAGQGGLPGSKVDPAPGFTDPVTGGPTYNGPVTRYFAKQPGETSPSILTDFQQFTRESDASCGETGSA